MESTLSGINIELDVILAFVPRLIFAVGIIIIMLLLARLIGKGLKHLAQPDTQTQKSFFVTRRIINWLLIILGIILALQILGMTALATSLLATGGFMAIILGFAFKEIGENLLAGLFMTFSRSFQIGDLIENNGLRGTVRGINLKDIQIRTAEGCDIFIPCVSFFRNPILNFTRDGLRRSSFRIGLDYGDDLRKANDLLLKVLYNTPQILANPKPSVDISSFSSQTVDFDVYFWVDTFDKKTDLFAIRSNLMHNCHHILDEHGFVFSAEVSTAVTMPPLNVHLHQNPASSQG